MRVGDGRRTETNFATDSSVEVRLRSTRLSRVLLLLFFAGPAIIARAQNVEDLTGKIISQVRIRIEGSTVDTAAEEYRREIQVRDGVQFSASLIRSSLANLLTAGLASNARAEATAGPGESVIVTFFIVPLARIGVVEFEGLTPLIPAEDLRARLTELERGSPYSETAVKTGADQIIEILRDRGYYQASVEPSATIDATGSSARVVYRINTGDLATISSVTLTGAMKIPEATLRASLTETMGGAFSRTLLNDDVQALRKVHLDAGHLNVTVGPPELAYDRATNSVAIKIPLDSGPVFAARVEGYEIKPKKLREILPLLRDGGVDDTSLTQSANRLRTYLQEEGYFFAEVEPPLPPDPMAERSDLVFKADPKQRYRLTNIALEGTTNITLEDVTDQMRSRTESFFPIPIFSKYTRGLTSEDALRRDAALIVSRLNDLGFRQARIVSVNRAINPDNDKLRLIFNVEDGPRSYISDVSISGNQLATVDQIKSLFNVRPGAPASLSTVRLEGNKVLDYYFQRGYALATISARLIDIAPQRVKVVYELKEGPQVYVNRIWMNEIGTRRRTRYGRLNTFLRFGEGDLMRADELALTEQDLYALGAFRRVVIRSEALGPENETGVVRRDIFVDLDEGSSRNLIYGVGYSTDDGVRGTAEISDPNIFGRLTTASFRIRVSQRDLLGQLSYTDPRPFGYRLPTLVSALIQREHRPAFDSRRATALIQVEKRLTDRSLMLFRYSYEDVRVNHPENVTEREDAPIRLGRVSTSYLIDFRDNPFDARKGHYHTVDFSFASTKLGGTENFFRFFTEHQYFRSLSAKRSTVLAFDARVGMARRYGTVTVPPGTDPVEAELLPITERFFTGGSTTLRGYDFEEAGPRDRFLTPRGGNALVVLNAEIRRSIYRQVTLVGFYDTGNVFISASRMKFEDFTHSLGLGIRVNTPLGPFRLDVAYLATSPQTGLFVDPSIANQFRLPRWQFHFSFGQAF